MKSYKNLILAFIVIALMVIPFILAKNGEFSGADNQAQKAVSEINPDYKPWTKPFWKPPGSEVESFLFALQAALGAGFAGYFIGLTKGRKERHNK